MELTGLLRSLLPVNRVPFNQPLSEHVLEAAKPFFSFINALFRLSCTSFRLE